MSALPRGPATEAEPTAPRRLALGDALPDAAVLDDEGARATLSELAGEAPLVLAFFARWCQPCRAELAQLQRSVARLPSGTRVLAVSLDEGPASRAVATARRWGFEGDVVRDAGAAAALGVPPLPGLFVFDADGRLRGAWTGDRFDEPALLRALRAPAERTGR